ncbi:uncharacterized protein LOC132263453 [Phlebotomus argentipes]|uniref:uncharacterized protein LOC132263453 n=1 Tax=Phlebotomus argentipes TaxID=94469 RepID=UPI0028934C97|nr:uncharacterized protein LOC132263453 [Phlebotomus argentipes]
MLNGRNVPGIACNMSINGHKSAGSPENVRDAMEWRNSGRAKKGGVPKSAWNVIEISSSSETEEEANMTLNPLPSALEQKEDGAQSPTECWSVQNGKSINMLRRDYGKKAPYRIFQVPSSPKAAVAGKEEFYNYLGIYSKPPFAKVVDRGPELFNRRSLRVCFIKKLKEHKNKMSELEKQAADEVLKSPASPVTAKDSIPTSTCSPTPPDSSATIVERRNYIQVANAAAEEAEAEVRHRVCDLSHQPLDGASPEAASITEKTVKRVRDKERKSRLKSRKRMHKKIFKTTYFIRSSVRNCVLRSGKVRNTSDRRKKLQKRDRKDKEEPEVEKSTAERSDVKVKDVIVLTDDEDIVEIVESLQKSPPPPPPKVVSKALEQVIGVHLYWPCLLIVQQQVVSFWRCSEIASILDGQQNWQKVGEVKRRNLDLDIPAAIAKRILHAEKFGCAYIELKGQELQKIASQEADYVASFVNVHFLKGAEATIHSIALDRICGRTREMCYSTLPGALSFVVTWYEHVSSTKRRTGICRYSLTPDLETLASIWEFSFVDNRVRSLSVASEWRIIGVGEQHVNVWNYTNGNLLTNIDLTPLELGDNIFTCLVQENKQIYLLLAQLHGNSINNVAINLLDFQYKILHTHENVNLTIETLSSCAVANGVFVAAFANGDILLLKTHQSDFLRRKCAAKDTNIFISSEHVVEIGEKIAIKSLLDFLT